MNTVYINAAPIELNKLLKFESLVSSGGEAKMVIENGLVKVNGSIEKQKRKKLNVGDIVQFMEQEFIIALDI
ncbi:RNA-binding S4 domain-containing protein [Psychrosphaera haliotis]|uniref:RNA-binding S4 domain-containing protein n=1 Tax=Psychrosphaera haliotis TaxID=555083 RepID=A0A6N8F8P5_9GAMM|nr:RNA-binding S4 domain-containing protein [Psychrosphaera haliotis]MUH71769.1 RNA-binding S4 domain-containing protein [Psychrosphaera haliotis]